MAGFDGETAFLLGRIEEGIDQLKSRFDRLHEGLYGQAGMESRVRKIEASVAVLLSQMESLEKDIKKEAGKVSSLVSFVTAVVSSLGLDTIFVWLKGK